MPEDVGEGDVFENQIVGGALYEKDLNVTQEGEVLEEGRGHVG